MKISDKITVGFYNYLQYNRTADVLVQNIFLGHYEFDIMHLKKSGYITEYEIKILRADFFNDFKKGDKHIQIKNKLGVANRFYYLVPDNLISVEEVPSYVGLIYFNVDNYEKGYSYITIIKPAPMIHKNIYFDTVEKYFALTSKLSFRENNWRSKFQNKKTLKVC